MKTLLATLGFAALLGPAIAGAQNAPTANSAAAVQSHMAQFEQFRQKMEQLHTQARAQTLAAISPAHKAQLATILGQLAVETTPNPEAAARQINAMLSPSEAQAVVRIHDTTRTQAESMMQSMHSQMQHSMPPGAPEQHARMMQGHAPPHDAGHLLLMLGAHGGGHMMMFPHTGM